MSLEALFREQGGVLSLRDVHGKKVLKLNKVLPYDLRNAFCIDWFLPGIFLSL
jgi:hypothetical protein